MLEPPNHRCARFTMMTKTLQTRIHRLPRTLEPCALITSFSWPKPTPWAGLTLGDHCCPRANPWHDLLNLAKDNNHTYKDKIT